MQKLICNYSKNNLIIDSKYIDKCIDIVANDMELNNYIKKVTFLKNREKVKPKKNTISISVADKDFANLTYNFITHEIVVYIDKVPKIYEYIGKFDFGVYENVYSKTVIYTQKILHELFHADQNKTIIKEKDNLEARLFASCINKTDTNNLKTLDEKLDVIFRMIERTRLYIEYYKYNPLERAAVIDSYQKND